MHLRGGPDYPLHAINGRSSASSYDAKPIAEDPEFGHILLMFAIKDPIGARTVDGPWKWRDKTAGCKVGSHQHVWNTCNAFSLACGLDSHEKMAVTGPFTHRDSSNAIRGQPIGPGVGPCARVQQGMATQILEVLQRKNSPR